MPERPEPQTTPIKHTKSKAATFASSSLDISREQLHLHFAEDMRMELIGPMPINEFLEAFMPPHSEAAPQVGEALENTGSPEKAFIDAVERHGLCPSLQLVDTKNQGDKSHPKYAKPDISVFNRDDTIATGEAKNALDDTKQENDVRPPPQVPPSPKSKRSRKAAHSLRMCFPILEIPIECKPEDRKSDPFTETDSPDEEGSFLHDTYKAKCNLGQLIQYATAQLSAQFRAFSFSILLHPNSYRLIRWDRAGGIVTKRMSLGSDGQYLAEFLWRFNHMTPEQRGRDPTVCRPTKAEADLAKSFLESAAVREYLKDMNGQIDVSFTTLHKFHVHDEETKKDHYFVAPNARWYTYAPTGRCTFGYIAFDLKTHDLVYLKDTWRADVPEIKPEGVTYRLLHKHTVPYIAGLVCSGDVGEQKTRTQEFKSKPWVVGKVRVAPHAHYRIVLDTIGRPLKSSKSSRELSISIRHAIESHWIAYSKARVLHRDVSGGNILIRKSKDGEGYEGLLIDWELSRSVDLNVSRRDWRTGTWQFIAAEILMQTGVPHELRHDLESFFHVLLYHVLRYCHHSLLQAKLESDMETVFDSSVWDNTLEVFKGGSQKLSVFDGRVFPQKDLRDYFKPPLLNIIKELRAHFGYIYDDQDQRFYNEEVTKASFTFLSNSENVMAIFDKQLEEPDWPADDAGRDNLAGNAGKRVGESMAYNRGKRVRSLEQGSEGIPLPSNSFYSSLPGLAEEK